MWLARRRPETLAEFVAKRELATDATWMPEGPHGTKDASFFSRILMRLLWIYGRISGPPALLLPRSHRPAHGGG